MPEATPEFKQQLREAFDSIHVGQTFTFRRTFTEGDVALFCGVTGDGFLATEMHFYYVAPVYIGDTITCTVTFTEKDENQRLFHATASSVNQDGVEVLKSQFSGFPAQVRLAR